MANFDDLLLPIVQRQERINQIIILKLAKHINAIGKLTASDFAQLEALRNYSVDLREIYKEIELQTSLNVQEIQNLIFEAGRDVYNSSRLYYEYAKVPFVPYEENQYVQKVVTAIAKQTVGTYTNMSQATAFMIRDPKNPSVLVPTPLAKMYQSVIDEAIQASQSGVLDYYTAMRRTLNQLVNSGLRRVAYSPESGRLYTQRLDTAVKRNLLGGIRAVNQGVQDEVGKQFGADGKEITVHTNSAPDHEPVQGHQFTNEQYDRLQSGLDFVDYTGMAFTGFPRPIGQWNCRHFTYSVILGVVKPTYTLEQLEAIKQKNAKGYTAPDGKHYTMYECTQVQRGYETEIRYAKEKYLTLKEAGDEDGAKAARGKVMELSRQYKAFSNACGLGIKPQNTRVSGYK